MKFNFAQHGIDKLKIKTEYGGKIKLKSGKAKKPEHTSILAGLKKAKPKEP